MTTLRIARRRRFTRVDTRTLDDTTLSFRAIGLLVWLLSKPDDWTINSTTIARAHQEGRDAVRTALRELETSGYLVRTKTQDDSSGLWSTESWLYEHPDDAPQAVHKPGDNPTDNAVDNDATGDGKPGVGKPGVGLPGAKSLTTITNDYHLPPNPREAGGTKTAGSKRSNGTNPRAQGTNPRAGDGWAKLRRDAADVLHKAAALPGEYPRVAWFVGGTLTHPNPRLNDTWDNLVSITEEALACGPADASVWTIAAAVERRLESLTRKEPAT